jgi:hypothetical protein
MPAQPPEHHICQDHGNCTADSKHAAYLENMAEPSA